MAKVVDCLKAQGYQPSEAGAKYLVFRPIFTKEDSRAVQATYNDVLPGGNSKRHSHVEEHVTFIVSGKGVLEGAEGVRVELKAGMAIYFPPHDPHCFINTSDIPLVMFGLTGPVPGSY